MSHTAEILFCIALGSFLAWRNKRDAAAAFFAVAAYIGLRLLFLPF
jgi:hypothetical protein